MILSSPFSRQNRSHQTWTNGQVAPGQNFGSLRRANNSNNYEQQQQQSPRANGATQAPAFKSLTLNRLDIQRKRQQQRNLSSLGNYPSPSVQPPPTPSARPQPRKIPAGEIYAPASIASPREFAHHQRPAKTGPHVANGESAHYAATSFRGHTPSESGRSGRESALGNLLERFGTLTRRGKWRRSNNKVQANGLVANNSQPLQRTAGAIEQQPTALDPEIYATGKREVKADEIYAEGSRAIDSNSQRRLLQHQLNETLMAEGETRLIIEESSKRQTDYQALVVSLTNWINDELAMQRIIIRDLQEDLHDGQILGKLVEKLHRVQLDVVEVTQNEITQRQKLRMVLDQINRILSLQARWARIRWTVEGIHNKDMVEIIHLLVTLALYYRAPIKIPPNVQVHAIVIQKHQGQLTRRSHLVQLTDDASKMNPDHHRTQRDAFDVLVEFAPDKLTLVKTSLVRFANRHLNRINMSCLANRVNDVLDPEQFSDGLLFVFLIASLEEYFVPLGNLFTAAPQLNKEQQQVGPDENNNNGSAIGHEEQQDTYETITTSKLQTALEPDSYINTLPIHKLHNVNLALQLMEEAGVEVKSKVRAEDIVNGDLKSVLRVLYALFSRYKHI